ncbi:MAG: DNA polymerase, partial [Candidatus Magasanikbacteria bacterium]|nr:DNA polymerase [Candidatus Magasanikbacteria bacterium]
TTFNQAVASTRRLSSSNPNLHNIPIKGDLGTEMRKCFIAEKGYKLLGLDYSQIELRVIASLANDPEMIKIFQEGRDIHAMTAARVNNVTLAEVTLVMRSAAKAINFGIIYGMGVPHSLAESIGVSFMEAKEFIARYFSVFKEVKKFLDDTRALAHSTGYVETLFGRRRYLPDINSGMPQLRNAAERMATNAPIQGTAADLIKLAMIEVYAKLKDQADIKMLLQVHDELVFEVKEAQVEKYAKQVKDIMENVLKLRVPVKVDAEFGDNWGEMEGV